MADDFGSLLAVWQLVALMGGVLAANALVDLGSGPLRAWRSGRHPGDALDGAHGGPEWSGEDEAGR